jgi:hypothetical protein
MERDGILRMIEYIKQVDTGHAFTSSLESRERDFKSFYAQYDVRRNKDILAAFPEIKTWWDSIPETKLDALKEVIDGDDAKSNRYVHDVLKKAKEEGWVLNPQWHNPGSQEYIEPDHQQQDDMIDLIDLLKKESDNNGPGFKRKLI